MNARERAALEVLAKACGQPTSRWAHVTRDAELLVAGAYDWASPDGSYGQCRRDAERWVTAPPDGAYVFAWLPKKGGSP